MRTSFVVLLLAAGTLFFATGTVGRPSAVHSAAFDPSVSVTISDDAPGSHPDITTTIDASVGPTLSRVRVLTAARGDIARDADISEGMLVGWIAGFTTIPASDGTCSQRYAFEVPLMKQSANAANFPSFLRDEAPGPHRLRYGADVAGTPVNVIVDDVQIAGEPRLQTTTYIGDPAHVAPTCAPFRSRVILFGNVGTVAPTSITTAPPTPGPRVYSYTLTASDGTTADRTVTASVQPGLRPRISGSDVQWASVPGATRFTVSGDVTFSTKCELERRLVLREEVRSVAADVPGGASSAALPAAPSNDYALRRLYVQVSAYDAEGVLLARQPLEYADPVFNNCWYAPGTEPLLSVDPASGPCSGSVTFHGSRFPTGLRVQLNLARFGTDSGGTPVSTAPVGDDGTFEATAALPPDACLVASAYPGGKAVFWAYNADEPQGLTVFASAKYVASVPPGLVGVTGPNTGTGPAASGRPLMSLWLLAAGVSCVAAGAALRRRQR